MLSLFSPERIAGHSARHPWITAALWVLIVLGAFMGAGQFKTNDSAADNTSYESERARVLLIRLEDLNRVHSAAVKEFLGIDDLTIVKASSGDASEFPMVYEAFLRSLTLPSWYVDEIYASRYTRHFYTEEEIRGFRNRWKTREDSSPDEGEPASIA